KGHAGCQSGRHQGELADEGCQRDEAHRRAVRRRRRGLFIPSAAGGHPPPPCLLDQAQILLKPDRPRDRRKSLWRITVRLTAAQFTGISAVVFATLLLLWWGAAAADLGPPLFPPGPRVVLRRLIDLAASGQLQADTLISVQRIMIGF